MSHRILVCLLINCIHSLMALSHTVGPSDTLYSISQKYGASVESIRRINSLANNVIQEGNTLEIPSDEEIEILVQSGDTLSHISYIFDIDQHRIIALNQLSTEELSIGQKLKIPPPLPEGTWRVLPGDSLLGIALNHNLSVAQLMAYNFLEDDTIYPNQILSTTPPHPEAYRVSLGDSLWSIAQYYGLTISQLREWNQLEADKNIHPGDLVKLYPHIEAPSLVASGLGTEQEKEPSISLASVQRPEKKKPEIPQFGEYYYSAPKKQSQTSVSYWEDATSSPLVDYKRALKVIELFQIEVEQMPVLSRQMQGWYIMLDPGHGGLDPGAMVSVRDGNGNPSIITEDEYAYDVAMRVRRILLRHGAYIGQTVIAPDHHIRDAENARATFVNRKNEVYSDEKHNRLQGWRPVGTVDGLDLRKTITNEFIEKIPVRQSAKRTIFISIHADNSKDLPAGTAILYDGADEEERERSKSFASVMASHMGNKAFIHRQTLRVLNNNPADAAILIEVRNLHYSGNAWALRSAELREQDARKIADGVLDWIR